MRKTSNLIVNLGPNTSNQVIITKILLFFKKILSLLYFYAKIATENMKYIMTSAKLLKKMVSLQKKKRVKQT